jgi:hypothetical protein
MKARLHFETPTSKAAGNGPEAASTSGAARDEEKNKK